MKRESISVRIIDVRSSLNLRVNILPILNEVVKSMSTDSQSIFDQALALPFDERAELAERLWASLENMSPAEGPAEVEADWIAVAERRMAEMDAGTAQTVSGEEVLAMLRANRRNKP